MLLILDILYSPCRPAGNGMCPRKGRMETMDDKKKPASSEKQTKACPAVENCSETRDKAREAQLNWDGSGD